MQSGISAAILFIWQALQNPASLSTGGTKNNNNKKRGRFPTLHSKPPLVNTLTQN